MPQIHSPYSSQLELTVAALPTINLAKGCAWGQQGPLSLTLIFNDENKRAHTPPPSHEHTPPSAGVLPAEVCRSDTLEGDFQRFLITTAVPTGVSLNSASWNPILTASPSQIHMELHCKNKSILFLSMSNKDYFTVEKLSWLDYSGSSVKISQKKKRVFQEQEMF